MPDLFYCPDKQPLGLSMEVKVSHRAGDSWGLQASALTAQGAFHHSRSSVPFTLAAVGKGVRAQSWSMWVGFRAVCPFHLPKVRSI